MKTLTTSQRDFIENLIDLAPAIEVVSRAGDGSDENRQKAIDLFCDHVREALEIITPLAKDEEYDNEDRLPY